MPTFQIRITASPIPAGFGFTARGFIDSLHVLLAKTTGGACVGVVDGGVITLEARGAEKEELTSLVDSYCGSLRKEGRAVEVVVIENPHTALSESVVADAARLNAGPSKLTKSFFMKLRPGTFLVSNLLKGRFESVFAELVEDTETKLIQWERIRACGADQRACHTFPTEAHYRHWVQQQMEYFSSLKR